MSDEKLGLDDVSYLRSLGDKAAKGQYAIGRQWFYDFARKVEVTLGELGDGEPSPLAHDWYECDQYGTKRCRRCGRYQNEGEPCESGAAQEVSPRSWSEQMAQVQPCGHTEAQHMYHTEGYIKLDLSECTSNGVPSIPAKAEAHKADAVKAVSASSAQEVSPPSPRVDRSVSGTPEDRAKHQLGTLETWRGDTRELKAALRWIPVEERLPKDSGSYLIVFRSGLVDKAWFNDAYKVWGNNPDGSSWYVTHWQPLPKPPELG